MRKQRTFLKSIEHAVQGLFYVAQHEVNFRIQLTVGTIVLIVSSLIPLATWERVLLILMIAAVLVLEVLNTTVERISDALKPRLHPMVKEVKDMMAGAVLLTAITAVTVAIFIFKSYLFPTG